MRFFAALCLTAVAVSAQPKYSVAQLVAFVRSAIQLKQPDKDVAAQLHSMHLSEKLEDVKIEMLQGEGAGPKTVAVLKELGTSSQSLVVAPPPPPPVVRKSKPPPSYAEQQKIIDQMREYALNYSSTLPDFVCKQITQRYYDPLGHENWRTSDVIAAKLSYVGQQEHYEVLMANGQPVLNKDMHSLGGTTSTGEFGSLLKYIFDPKSDAEFHWDRWGNIRTRLTHVFTFSVDQAHSTWGITDGETKRTVTPAYNGFIYVDSKTGQIVRINMQSVDIPADFPIQLANTQLDYDFTELSGQQFLLPLKAEIRLDRGRYETKNDVKFLYYQKFSADAVITFDAADTLPDEKTEAKPVPPPKPQP